LETRPLLDTDSAVNDKILYAHQYGRAGSELSPFFRADNRRTYFVQPLAGFAPARKRVAETKAVGQKDSAASAAVSSAHATSATQIQLSSGQAVTESQHY
jgi:hypothetical protein